MNVLDLFSGIGGFSLGLERAGMRTVAFCERDEFCRAVLRKHWPNVPCFDDIRAIDADGLGRLGRIDLVCGGFPCQPFSVAGKQKAQADDRHLWPAMRKVIALTRPAFVVGENVTGIIALALDDVLSDLEGLGFTPRTFVIPAAAVGAYHRRDRVWIVAAHADGQRLEGRLGDVMRECGAERTAGARRASAADTESVLRAAFLRHEQVGADNSARCAWLPEPGVGRVADGVPRRVDRLRCLGNAVVPQVVEEIGRAIMRCSQ